MYKFALGTAAVGLALVTLAAAGGGPKGTAGKSLDGAWSVVCYEKDGQPQADAMGMTVKADAGTFTCSGRDGKAAMTLKVTFGASGTVQVTEGTGDTSAQASPARSGVYVLTRDYVAISLNADPDAGGESRTAADGQPAQSRCSIILKREGARPDGDK